MKWRSAFLPCLALAASAALAQTPAPPDPLLDFLLFSGVPPQHGPPVRQQRETRAELIESGYKAAVPGKPGRFTTGQAADVMLGGFGFEQSGGAGVLNHPTGLATDGTRLLVVDRWNHRVLIWHEPPSKNSPPDLVLGQKDFTTAKSDAGRSELNWPGNAALSPDGTRLAVADTNNSRVLLWNSFPKSNAAPADLAINLAALSSPGMMRHGWPWGVWTDGTKLAVVATHGSAVLIWNAWPTRDDQAPDFVLRPEKSGTPRNITSDGTVFMLSDHNYGGQPGSQQRPGAMRSGPATMVWRTFPTGATQPPDFVWNEWFKGCITPQGQLVLGGLGSVHVFNRMPQSQDDRPDVTLFPQGYGNGDGPDAVFAGGRLYVCNYNGNNILAWNSIPQHRDEPPAFALGADDLAVNMWDRNFFIQNPVVATNGESLFVSSDFDRKLFVWRKLPDESAAKPDVVFHLADGPWDNALHGDTLVLGGKDVLTIWKKLPLHGEPPDVVLRGRIGSAELREITGVAMDKQFLYVADRQANRIYVWHGIPGQDTEPRFIIRAQNPARLHSDGTWLTVAPFEGQEIAFYKVDDLARGQAYGWLGGRGMFNLPGDALVSHGMLFVADRSFNRVHVWHRIEDAFGGSPADAWLGARDGNDHESGNGADKLYMPGSVAFDGTRVWVGEQKFSTRILRYSPALQMTGR